MKTLKIMFYMLAATLIVVTACNREKQPGEMTLLKMEPVLPEQTYEYANISKPAHIPSDFNVSEIENNVATLGRVLFYDKMLSINNSVACASCHIQQLAFSDGKSVSGGITEAKTSRNSMAIMNAGRESSYFWDLREKSLKSMVLKPVQNHVEMGFDNMAKVVANVQQTDYYKDLFEKAFGSPEVTEEKLASALSQFIASMKSHSSKYDIGKQTDFANFNSMELIGMDLFTRKLHCQNCHQEPDFAATWGGARNIGLDLVYTDDGVGASSNDVDFPGIRGGFKVPSLRNIELTGPYMHDGRFNTLEEVVEHYNSKVQNHPYLDWSLRTITNEKTGEIISLNEPIKLNLNQTEKDALVAFLKTLTDYSYVNDVRFSNPFRVVN